MRGLLKIFIIIFFICFLSNSYAQVDPTIPLPQRNLQNNLTNPIINDNPFIDQKLPSVKKQKNVPSNSTTNQNQMKKENEPIEDNEEEKEEKKEVKEENSNKKEEAPEDKDEGLLGPFRIGPMIGFGILMGPNISIESKIFRYIGLSVSYGFYNNFDMFRFSNIKSILNSQSQDFQFNTLTLSYSQLEGKISIFPFGGSFFIGASYGRRLINLYSTGTLNVTIPNYPTKISTPFNENITINSIYWTPQMGLLATWSGSFGWFAIGTEIGVQLTLDSTVTTSTTFTDPTAQSLSSYVFASPEYTALSNQLSDSITTKLKEYPLPYWNILKIGWIF
ncbi:hypothetical protein GCL60_06290 [Silvanigrella paludirubra]|uniref:Outer membrane beta-barrel protein n=1 Tax=Silvanigrella paludirubra TaxID=2499159 RepID=A0A6N6VVT4_9BACT|nr:hypothetical protein [Silvanigrella paludirubra]KAB8039869.1 hypothetical protein GCL60_06290 [Silvanigrella paludirubra]